MYLYTDKNSFRRSIQGKKTCTGPYTIYFALAIPIPIPMKQILLSAVAVAAADVCFYGIARKGNETTKNRMDHQMQNK